MGLEGKSAAAVISLNLGSGEFGGLFIHLRTMIQYSQRGKRGRWGCLTSGKLFYCEPYLRILFLRYEMLSKTKGGLIGYKSLFQTPATPYAAPPQNLAALADGGMPVGGDSTQSRIGTGDIFEVRIFQEYIERGHSSDYCSHNCGYERSFLGPKTSHASWNPAPLTHARAPPSQSPYPSALSTPVNQSAQHPWTEIVNTHT